MNLYASFLLMDPVERTNFILGFIGLIIVAVLFGLWVSAIVSTIRNKQIAQASQKAIWIMLNLILGSIGNVIYFFKFKFLKRAWLSLGLIVAFVVLIVMYSVNNMLAA